MATCKPLKREIQDILLDDRWEARLDELLAMPPRKSINPLFSALCSLDPCIKWRGITAFGQVVKTLAEDSMEQARIIMRRLTWSLNDESGGIGWGAPEAIGESIASYKPLADEYHRILLSYIHEDESGEDNHLELPQLRVGAMWGIARLAQVYPELINVRIPDILLELHSDYPELKALACKVLGLIRHKESLNDITSYTQETYKLTLFWDRCFVDTTLGNLAAEAAAMIQQVPGTEQ